MTAADPADLLLATCWSSAGDAASDRADLRSPLPLHQRVAAAAAAGFGGFGLLSADLPAAVAAYGGLGGIRTLLDDHGITVLELEGVPDWWDGDRDDPVRRAVLEAAAAGVRLGIEFFPWSNVGTLADGLALVEAAGHPGGGVVVDAWHVFRAGTPLAEVAGVDPARLVGVELDDADAAVVGTLFADTVHRRRHCGEGSFDLPGLVAALRTAGWAGPWRVEILSVEHRALPVRDALVRAADSARSVLRSARTAP